jgi:uncharacterized protein (TIGR01370 family)
MMTYGENASPESLPDIILRFFPKSRGLKKDTVSATIKKEIGTRVLEGASVVRVTGHRRRISGAIVLVAALLSGGCAGGGSNGVVLGPNPQSSVSPTGSPQVSDADPHTRPHDEAKAPHSLVDIKSWAEPSSLPTSTPTATLAALTAQTASLLILDPAMVSPTSKVNLLSALHQNSEHRVLALLDISEIAPTNPLWQSKWIDAKGKPTTVAPAWLLPSASKTPGVFPVQYWNPDWQKSLEATVQKIAAQGYDGVCLQGVGNYSAFLKSRRTAGPDMAALIETLVANVRKTNPAFSVVTDGGAMLPATLNSSQSQAYLDAVDGVLAHDVFYPGDKPADNPLLPNEALVTALDVFQKAGKSVFVTERLTDPAKIADDLARAHSKGYLPEDIPGSPAVPPTPSVSASPAPVETADQT